VSGANPLLTPGLVFVALAAVFGYASWRAALPPDPARPRMVPWRGISVTAAALTFLALLYLVAQLREPS
jgi:putative copper export protein